MTLEEVYTGLSDRMDIITDELVKVSRNQESLQFRLGSIEANITEVELKNGGNRMIKQSRQQLNQDTYDQIKQGGMIDQRITNVRSELIEQLSQCKTCHNPEEIQVEKEKKWDKAWKWSTRIAIVIIAVITILFAVKWENFVFKW
ncbi:MAG TPA: hypothetical protein PLK82_02310 [Bacteroidales bacterium]|jgi:hypothetical protein|nr:hypothetical protein [Bacteroidales bacterium]